LVYTEYPARVNIGGIGITDGNALRPDIYRDVLYRNVTIATVGVSYKFSLANNEELYNKFPESGMCSIAGTLETVVRSYEKDGRPIKVCENNLLLEKVGKNQTAQPEPKQRQQAA